MSELKALLIQLIKGKGSLDEARVALEGLLSESPDKADDVARLLQGAHKAGLKDDYFEPLHDKLEHLRGNAGEAEDDKTVVLPAEDQPGDAAPPASRSADGSPGEAAGGPAGRDPDATVLAVDADRAVDPDATVLATDADQDTAAEAAARDGGPRGPDSEDPTAVDAARGQADADDDEDATAINAAAGDDEDATAINAAAGADEDATAINAAAGDDEDATAINAAAGADEDATAINAAAGDSDATEVNAGGDPDKTAVMGEGGEDGFDIFDPDNLAAMNEPTGQSGQTGASWPTAAPGGDASGAGIDREFREGDLLRGRFEFISKLGEGGMGAVWKGKDKLKEEARDRNPYVAIKLLQGDFKQHPEAFIALQRETAKQQRLAHPNIATVYDFDRDEYTGTVFMTMEVMDGQPMDAFVRKIPADGLPEEEAMPIIEDLCSGLAYAHNAKLVHSDLKPGNAFLVKDPERPHGRVKLLDFGIARASKTGEEAEGETTLFDPGQLGALTPTYATIEMFDGKDPDPRDDIYALAIMAYQLFTGKHPYGKKSAPKAKELGLVPEPVAKLDKRQNKALRRGLAFHRDERTPTVEEFLEEITKRKSRAPYYLGGGLAATVLIGALAWSPVNDLINERKRDEIIESWILQPGIENIDRGLKLASELGEEQLQLVLEDERTKQAVVGHIARGDEQSISEALVTIQPYDDDWEMDIRSEDAARTAIVDLYQQKIDNAFNVNEQKYDFAKAQKHITRLDQLYPDSATVLGIRNELTAQKTSKLSELSDKYKNLLNQGLVIPTPGSEDIADVLAVVERLDPQHRLLTDKQLRFKFADLAEQAIAENDFARADSILEASQTFDAATGESLPQIAALADTFRQDPRLNDLSYQVETELARIANEQLVTEIEQRLREEMGSFESLADFQRVRDDLITLADLSPTNEVLTQIQDSLKRAFSAELDSAIAAKDWGRGEELLVDFAKLLEIPYLTGQRTRLSAAESKAGHAVAMTDERKAQVESRIAKVEELLANPKFNSEWEIALKVPYKELIALLPLGDPALEPVRNQTARLYLDRAVASREAGRFGEASDFLEKGRIFYPGLKNFADEEQAIADAREAQRLKEEEEKRLARLESLKGDLLEKAAANEPDAAREILAELEQGLPADDEFVNVTGPEAIAKSYMRLAEEMTEREPAQYEAAVKFAQAGLALAPDLQALEEALPVYEAEVAKRELEIALRKKFTGLEPLDTAAVKADLQQLSNDFPDRYGALHDEFANARAVQITKYAGDPKVNFSTLAQRLEEYQALFPDQYPPLNTEVVDIIEQRIAKLPTNTVKQINGLARPVEEFKILSATRHAALSKRLGDELAARIKQLEKTNQGAAYELLVASTRAIPESTALRSIDIEPPPPPELAEGRKQMQAGKLTAAGKYLDAALEKMPDHSQVAAFQSELKALMSDIEAKYDKYVKIASNGEYAKQRQYDSMLISLRKQWRDHGGLARIKLKKPRRGECSPKLAGFGAKRSCYDVVAKKKKGPALVVVPPGGGNEQPFAISKYEISVKEYNLYCRVSGECERVRQNSRLPITKISVQDAEKYAAWLSAEASAFEKEKVVYRLPTTAEWEHAAKAGGKQPEKKFNCRVTSSGNIIAGHALINARSGTQNGWGLANYVGNAQEWTKGDGGIEARGGAFEDPLTKCDVSLARPHSGNPDEITSFRLVREMG